MIDWLNPNYDAIYTERVNRLNALRADKSLLPGVKEHYKTNPVEFITDWMVTVDPRNVERGLPAAVPFILFPRQQEYVRWVVERWRNREDFVVEKSRDMGVSWLNCAISVWLWLFHRDVVIGMGSRKETYVDKIGDPSSLFWKLRALVDGLPVEFQPKGWNSKLHAPFMRVLNPENGSSITGEAGDNIGRGARTSIYLVDEAAFLEHPEAIDAALSQTSNCKGHVSTPNGAGNPFYQKRHSGKYDVFIFDWRQDPRKNQEWYEKQCSTLDPVIVAQEIDRNYESSVSNVFIPGEIVIAAQARGPADVQPMGGLRVGIDVARFGDDKTVITFRRGRVLLKQVTLAKLDVAQVAGRARSETQ
jgi:phage terminase large subunit